MGGSSFKDANFAHAKLRGTNCSPLLFGAGGPTHRFNPCNFDGAKIRYADLKGAQMKSASFRGADLSYSDLTDTDLRDADFTGAVLNGAILEGAQTEGALFDRAEKPVFQMKAEEE